MLTRATPFEFRHRFWFILSAFVLAFLSYRWDHVNTALALVKVVSGRALDLDSLVARHRLQAAFGISAALVSAAAWMRTWGSAYLRAEVVFDSKVHSERLVADGPFRHVRNPLYFGNVLLAAGIGLLTSRVGWFILVGGMSFFVRRLIGYEESALSATQGESYRAYFASVPRLWLSLTPRFPAGGTSPQWLKAFFGEAWMWYFSGAGVFLAATLDFREYNHIVWATPALLLLRWAVLARFRRRRPG